MNFHYDPILGLQYTSGDVVFIIDIESLPNDFKNKWCELMSQVGKIPILNSRCEHEVNYIITSNVL